MSGQVGYVYDRLMGDNGPDANLGSRSRRG